ncbi:hypothetical protein GCM10010992_21870 [Cloacibacterium rupense]|uniref:Fibronectin type-III domain-containing protein n=1 Tax=Cloacibacterium rupense TaxID=517423 RepID=A0ABQ2NMA8_9FLAO|nr:fibronectin type III domain-containing protein [Cloacibacterium rupense]GGP05508.1 hypothetical protein GCM10010992_21870 [Cloacibacterium rupense]
MKTNILSLISAGLIMVACGGSGGDDPAPVPNTPPSVPTLVGPTDKSLCISNLLSFTWNKSTDSQNDAITYQIQVATDNQFTQIVNTANVSDNVYSITLDKGKAYYWRVKATDSKNASSDYSSTFSLYTEATATTNHLPFMPELVRPNYDASVATTVDLEWNASDVDASDVLSYDVFWGTDKNNLSTSKTNLSTKTTQLSGLQSATTYYWKVIVKDNKGGETIGQTWSFKTN